MFVKFLFVRNDGITPFYSTMINPFATADDVLSDGPRATLSDNLQIHVPLTFQRTV